MVGGPIAVEMSLDHQVFCSDDMVLAASKVLHGTASQLAAGTLLTAALRMQLSGPLLEKIRGAGYVPFEDRMTSRAVVDSPGYNGLHCVSSELHARAAFQACHSHRHPGCKD